MVRRTSEIEYTLDDLRESLEEYFKVPDIRERRNIRILVDARIIFFLIARNKFSTIKIAEYLGINRAGLYMTSVARQSDNCFQATFKDFMEFFLDRVAPDIADKERRDFIFEEHIEYLSNAIAEMKKEKKQLDKELRIKRNYIKLAREHEKQLNTIKTRLIKYLYQYPEGNDVEAKIIVNEFISLFGLEDLTREQIYYRYKNNKC